MEAGRARRQRQGSGGAVVGKWGKSGQGGNKGQGGNSKEHYATAYRSAPRTREEGDADSRRRVEDGLQCGGGESRHRRSGAAAGSVGEGIGSRRRGQEEAGGGGGWRGREGEEREEPH